MTKQSISGTVRIDLRTDARLNIIIHLDITDAIIAHQSVDHLIRMRNYLRITEIQLIAASVVDLFAVAHEIPVIRHTVRLRTADSHDLQLQPDTRNHSLRPDIIHDLAKTARETLVRRQPFSDAVPPESVRIPAAVHAEILTPRFMRLINQRNLLFGRRISPQTVHIIIENNRKPLIITVFPADPPAVHRQLRTRLIHISVNRSDAHRHTRKALTRL